MKLFDIFKKKEKKPEYVFLDCVYNCGKEKCPKWVILTHIVKNDKTGETKNIEEGKCSDAWKVFLMVEMNKKLDIIANKSESKIVIPR